MVQRFAALALPLTALALAGCLAPGATLEPAAAPPGAASAFAELLCDPACNIRLSPDAGPANELGLAMDPWNPQRLLAGAKDYNDRYTDCVTTSWYYSEDGGRSWRSGYFHPPRTAPLPHPPVGGFGVPVPVDPFKVESQSCESDPVPVFDGLGNALMSTLSYGGSGTEPATGLPTYRLARGATEWEPVTHAYVGTTDKQWLDVDVATGWVYLNTLDAKEGAEHVQEVLVTKDGGTTWEHLAYFDDIIVAQLAVRPGGHVYLAGLLATRDADGFGIAPGPEVILYHSPDGGRTWDPRTTLATLNMGSFNNQGLLSNKLYRTPPLPAIAASDGAPRIAVAYFDDAGGEDWDVFVRVSRDDGRTWDPPVRVNDDSAGADQFIPAVALSPAGDVHVMWFDARNDPTGEGRLLDVYYAHSADAQAFDANLRISEGSFLPYLGRHQQQPFFMGDYLGIQASDQSAVMIWPDTRNERSEVFAAIVGGAPAGGR